MALHLGLSSLTINPFQKLTCFATPPSHVACKIQCATDQRRYVNFQPSPWNYKYIQSLKGDDQKVDENNAQRIKKLKKEVRNLIYEEKEILYQLELIDALQQLGIDHHFEKEIKYILATAYASVETISMILNKSLCATTLLFRLLREHGFHVSQDIFKSFKDEKGSFKADLSSDAKCILSLYEASYQALEGETILDEARDFTTNQLKDLNTNLIDDPRLREHVAHALELPLNMRMRRLHTRWFIDAYEKEDNMHPLLLELAKLDFNIIQAAYQSELKEESRWWNELGFGNKLKFARDRLVECYLWAIGWAHEPKLCYYRKIATRVNCLLSTIDDIYDVYGTLEELELFTDAVDRWDVHAMERLPDYMKICFLALINSTNETAYHILKDKGIDIIPCLKKAWADLCKSFLVEARWASNGYIPKFEEYLDNAWISSSGPLILAHAYCCVSQEISKESLEYFMHYPDVVRHASMIFRLCNDLAGSKVEVERGDVYAALQCHIHDKGVSEAVAHEHIRSMINALWKQMNGIRFAKSPFEESFIIMAMNFVRMVECMYQYGDGYTAPSRETKECIRSLLIEPIQLKSKDANKIDLA